MISLSGTVPITRAGFPNVNIDLISGMVGETTENWRENIKKTIDLSPDSVTIFFG